MAVVVYRGATVLDGTGAPARAGTTVVVEGGVLRYVGPDDEVPAALLGADGAGGDGDTELAEPADAAEPAEPVEPAEVVDLAGRYVIPGLIDSHQHLATPPDRALAEAVLRRDLLGGVTAVRDMADDLRQIADLARAALVGEIPAPDIHYAALMAGPSFFDDPRTWQVSQGATPGDLVARIVAEAKRQGIAVWAHAAVFPATPGEVVAAGVDSVSHVQLMVHEAAGRPLTTYRDKPPVDHERFASGDDEVVGALFARMREQGTILDATAGLWGRIALELGAAPEGSQGSEGSEGSDSGADADGAASAANAANTEAAEAADAAEAAEARARAAANDRVSAALTRQASLAGVTVSAGTDRDPDAAEPWPPLFDELEYFVERCGMTPVEALRCSSWGGALSLGAANRLGTLEAGKQADFVVLAADPAEDIRALRSVVSVVKRGRRFDRDTTGTTDEKNATAGGTRA